MQFVSLSKLNILYSSSFRRAVIARGIQYSNSVSNLGCDSQIFCKKSSALRYRGASAECRNFGISDYPKRSTVSSLCCHIQRTGMAASRSQGVLGDVCVDSIILGHGSAVDAVKSSSVFFGDKRIRSWRKAIARCRLANQARQDVSHWSRDSWPFFGISLRNLNTSPSSSQSKGANVNIPFCISARSEHVENPADSPSSNHVPQKSLKLLSGSCYLPHPDKIEKGGEDAHFICEEKGAIGVADGVGGWADVGVDAGEYARQLMMHSVSALQKDTKGLVDPAKVLEKAHADTKVIGSSTACIIALTDQGIHAINLGDSGFTVIRNGRIVFRSPAQQYGFNFPYQLASGNGGDPPSVGQVFTFPVAPGDVIVAGTDGLFDNLYDREISTLVIQAERTALTPEETARNIATLAQQRARDRHRQTPFSAAALEAGYRYSGGKLDDITVIVSYVTA